ncbi:helix-turn-helix domain-containing protein [Conexibacter arvalis]|uniref:DNA-binding CsgD family transcriptional regulator n=1 Tax=Conexibacter arvalis TaxID=912552 RepID=A0A840IJ23_9ACTN|nr:helix-turn-helix transcriptional regulator [Conexibacter arvalis]MBB4664231.1 DNA-binding CsgD family transcriptional regulator [Conexibacter arvalis]
MADGGAPGGAAARSGGGPEGTGSGLPHVVHAADARLESPSGAAAAVALDAVARQLGPEAATFFTTGAAGELRRSIVWMPVSPPTAVAAVARWKHALRDLDPLAPAALSASGRGTATLDDVGGLPLAVARRPELAAAYRRIGVVNDARLLVRAEGRLVGGITLWRSLRSRGWTPRQLAVLDALQPLVEHAYVEATSDVLGENRLVAALTAREREVARMIADGATNAEIARALHVGIETVKSHTRKILLKLGARTRRDVTRRLAPAAQPPWQTPQEDAATAERLLEALLRWSRERIDGVVGGYAALSGRGAVVRGEVAFADASAGGPAGERARMLHAALFAPEFVRDLARQPQTWDVATAEAVHPRADRIDGLAAGAGWSAPLVLVVRVHGRAAGLVWIARARRSDCLRERAVAELLGLQPLVEAAAEPLLLRAHARPPAPPAGVPRAGLTVREWEVARRSADGATNAEIAAALGIAEATVKAHMTRVMVKCGVRSRAQLIALMHRRATAVRRAARGGPPSKVAAVSRSFGR